MYKITVMQEIGGIIELNETFKTISDAIDYARQNRYIIMYIFKYDIHKGWELFKICH